jgi:hypothetical protein
MQEYARQAKDTDLIMPPISACALNAAGASSIEYPASRLDLDELTPWNWKKPTDRAAAA